MSSQIVHLSEQLAEARATIEALLSGQVDAVVDANSTPILLVKAQSALRESEERYRQIVESTTEGIIKIDESSIIVFANQRMANMIGYELKELVGKELSTFLTDETKPIIAAAIMRRRQGIRDTYELTLRRKNNEEISVTMSSAPVHDRDGQYLGSLAMIRDVTEQKKMMSQLMVSDRMASVGTLAAGVAHEINNPLAVVLGNLCYVEEYLNTLEPNVIGNAFGGIPFADIKAAIVDAREGAERVMVIVRDLKIFSRSPDAEVRVPVNIERTIEASLRMAWNEIRHRGRVVKNFGQVPMVEANEARLGQVFLNLIVNAAQALPECRFDENEIRVTTRLEGDQAIIEISDTGEGIEPAVIGRIFDAFFTTKAVGVGTGLGLAISHRIVNSFGGKLSVQSEVGKGSTFIVSLPVVVGDDNAAKIDKIVVPVLSELKGRILVVDDEPLVLRSVVRILSGHEVVTVSSAQEALILFRAGEKFDIILSDLMMPDMGGTDFHRELAIVAPEEAKKMILLTGGAFTPQAQEFLSRLDGEHIEKPFDANVLRSLIQRRLRALDQLGHRQPTTAAQAKVFSPNRG